MQAKYVIDKTVIRQIIKETLMIGPLYEMDIRLDVAVDLIVDEVAKMIERSFEIREKHDERGDL